MKKEILIYTVAILLSVFLLSNENMCSRPEAKQRTPEQPAADQNLELDPEFGKYWFQGQAELNVYDVQQERYGEIRQAQQVMVFVTEDFSQKKQVKLDAPQQAGADRLPILKLNSIRRFHTGIYDYSVMESIFSPLDGSPTLKVSTSVQDWCGHVFAQMNKNGKQYRSQLFSYFESEGDSDVMIADADFLECDFWTRLRLGPDKISTGRFKIIPSELFARFRHQPLKTEPAEIRFADVADDTSKQKLVIQYLEIDRLVEITFQRSFPYQIIGWEERYNGNLMSKGQLQKTIKSAYWKHHERKDHALRDSLNLYF